jgi:hypothetical protein
MVSRITVVGVTTRSQTRKPRTSSTNMIVFSPTAASPESSPPSRPAPTRATISPRPNIPIKSRRSGANRRLTQRATPRPARIDVKRSRTVPPGRCGARKMHETKTPTTAAGAPKRMARHSTATRLLTMEMVAQPMPTLWMAKEKRRAWSAGTASTLVSTGKPTAPPPSEVPPPPASRRPSSARRASSFPWRAMRDRRRRSASRGTP